MAEEQQNTNTIDDFDPFSEGTASTAEKPISVAELQQALTAKTEEAKGLNDKYLRLAAEFDNYKRLTQRDQRDQIRFGHESLLKELLPVVDNLERAIKASREGGSSDVLIQGVELTLKQLTGALTRFHVSPIETIGKPFDPATHQSVTSVASEKVPEHHVVDEFQRGYLLHDRILRAAMVSISTGRTDS
ncbi:MAG: nucleotide exchange factor GrpE [Nitrospirota bacterium]|nr:nucleotide exchange factor GrpE [Nitrospirota bacterium]MDP2384484.1 nucleotide exchange factor GrpE [Nitrospirota bacterium]MDP3598454.1 nucleotide exchange factor GrpE [Nitrospirota bacterium]